MMHEPGPTAEAPVAATGNGSTDDDLGPPPAAPQFDFYSLLPEEEVVVPAEPPVAAPVLPLPPASNTDASPATSTRTDAAAAPAPAQEPSRTRTAGSGSYLLQVGSFRSNADAERLRAELALLGIQTSIHTATIGDGKTYHRVRTAALEQAAANAVQTKLKRNGHESMMMRAR
jgi:cell division protein FtsN